MSVHSGEKDLEIGEIKRIADRLFGAGSMHPEHGRACIAKGKNDRCIVGVYRPGDMHKRTPYRKVLVLGEGASFAEAFRRAELRLQGADIPKLGGVDVPISLPERLMGLEASAAAKDAADLAAARAVDDAEADLVQFEPRPGRSVKAVRRKRATRNRAARASRKANRRR